MRRLLTAAALALVWCCCRPASAAAGSCPTSITACGCTIASSGFYQLGSDLTATNPNADCLDVKAANVNLWLDGHSISGTGSRIGLHLLKTARGAFIEGLDLGSGAFASVGSFAIGIEDDADGAIIGHTNVSDNSNVGVLLNRVNGSLVSDFGAFSNSYGVELSGATLCSIQRATLEGNSIYGMWLSGSSRNVVNFFEAQDNLIAGLYLGCQPHSGPTGGRCKPSSKNHIYDGPEVGPASASQNYGVAIDSGNVGNVLSGITAGGDAVTDLVDQNAGCSNLWFNNSGANNNPCIH